MLLLLAVMTAWALRVHRLEAQSLWYDEAVTAHVASQGIAELTRWTAEDIQPPLYYYGVSVWTRLMGAGQPGEWTLRFPSVAFGVLIVPLMWAVGRRLIGRGAGVAAAWLTALHPLYVYYSQEARMYTQLVFLGVLAGYLLIRAASAPSRPARWWAAFTGASAAMLYTHYFGAFLLIAYALCYAIYWLRHDRQWAHLWPALLSALGVVLLYVPWLPAMLTRYRIDRSYWGGALKLGEAVRHVAVSFTSAAPETMLETEAVRLLPFFGLALALAIAALLLDPKRRPALGWLLIVLIVPVFGVLAVASRTPKFNARYLMLASPAYLLILAGGFGALLHRTGTRGRAVGYALATALGLFLVAGALASVANWFTDAEFSKAQWRELATAVRAQRDPDEPVLLVSGHAWPAWDYYASDVPEIRLPDLDVLDVNATLGFETGAVLEQAVANKPGVWVVEWQDEVVDPAGFVPYFLDRAGREQATAGDFWQLAARHWLLRPDAGFPTEPSPDHDDGANFAHQVALTGWDDPRDGSITLYWRALNPIGRDLKVSLVFEDATGREVGRWDGRPARYDYPTTRWRPGEALFGRYPLPQSTVPGDYAVTVALYDDANPSGLDIMDIADNPAGKRARLGPVRIE
jgi:4-amino-4-deoxy-L-arabinose transferase-like glycosyltransferase